MKQILLLIAAPILVSCSTSSPSISSAPVPEESIQSVGSTEIARSVQSATASLADREVARRRALLNEARGTLSQAQMLKNNGQLEKAYQGLSVAAARLGESPATQQVFSQLQSMQSQVGTKWAEELAESGALDEARQVLQNVLAEKR